MVPFSPNIQTPGIFARDLDVMKKVAELVLPECKEFSPKKVLFPKDAFDLVTNSETKEILLKAFEKIQKDLSLEKEVIEIGGTKEAFQHTNQIIGYEAWNNHKEWIEKDEPKFSDMITARFQGASKISKEDYEKSIEFQKNWTKKMKDIIQGNLLIVPTAPDSAYEREAKEQDTAQFRVLTLQLNSIAGQGGLPQLHIPGLKRGGNCIGLSIISDRNTDLGLIEIAKRIKF